MDDKISNAITFIKDNLDKQFDLQTLSEVACLSPVHFCRRFKFVTGCTPKHYVEVHKVSKSLDLLPDAANKIQDIAYDLGFKNYETFTRVFSKHCQIAPGDLQSLLMAILKDSDKSASIIVSNSTQEGDLIHLVHEALGKEKFTIGELEGLRVFICSQKQNHINSRKPHSKYQVSYQPELSKKLVNKIHLDICKQYEINLSVTSKAVIK